MTATDSRCRLSAALCLPAAVAGLSLAALCNGARRKSTKASRLGWLTLKELFVQDFKEKVPAPAMKLATRALSLAASTFFAFPSST